MPEPTHHDPRINLYPSSSTPEPVHLAKWPPDDDDDVPAGPPGGGAPAGGGGMPAGGGMPGGGMPAGGIPAGGGFDPGDGNFKKGRVKPIAVIVGLLAVVGLVVFLVVGMEQEAEKIPVEQAAKIKKELLILPKEEQMPKWREYAASDRSTLLREEALKQLAWENDPNGVDLAIKALSDIEQPMRAHAATVLAEYGSPAADKARQPLLKAFAEAGPESKPQIAWALVVLGEKSATDQIMALYRAGHLSQVRTLDGAPAFNPNKLVNLIGIDKLATMAGDESGAVRQLAATVLSRHAKPAYTDPLIQLLKDDDPQISRQAAPGLGKIGTEKAREPLLQKLKGADSDSRTKYLQALRDGIGARGLVLALDAVSKEDRTKWWHRTKQIFDMLRELADMRAGDPLQKYIDSEPHIHWETIAAFAMAEVGDLRAVPSLARRLRMDALKIYSDETDYEMMLKRDNKERVIAARMLADLAVLHPDKLEQIRNESEDAVIFWMHELPQPHANGMRALAAMHSEKDLQALRDWANPKEALPLEGQQPPFPEEWTVAQSALRYIGWMKDEKSWGVLEKQLERREPELDVTMAGLKAGGLAILGMTLRAVGVGASEGFAEWGDEKAFEPLLKYIEEPKENEQSRERACFALAWVANKEDMVKVAEKIQEYDNGDAKDEVRRACLLETLITRPVPGTAPALLPLLSPDSSMQTRHQVARALGKAGFDESIQKKLFEMMNDEKLMVDATLALILGGDADTAARAVAMWADKSKPALEELQRLWFRSFGYWSHQDLEDGHIFRWVDNAQAISHVTFNETPQEWARVLLTKQFDNLIYDNGPHSFTRVVLRYRLNQMAKGDDAEKRAAAIRTLLFMEEQGSLLALREESGETGKLAAEAYHELMNPKIVTGVNVPEDED